jgi:hypothetical protein
MRKPPWFPGAAAVVTLAALAALAVPAPAWDSPGHEQIADIAWSLLSDAQRRKLADILNAGEPSFRPSNPSSMTSVRAAFRKAATFPDFIKSHKTQLYDADIAAVNRTFEPDIEKDHSDSQRLKCRTFHYYDTPLAYSGHKPRVRKSNAINAFNLARNRFRSLVHSHSDLRMQYFWLAWLIHLTGDLHQPLHCAERWAAPFQAAGDDGGNAFHILDPKSGRDLALHAFWDGGIGRARRADPATFDHTVTQVTELWKADPTLQPEGGAASVLNQVVWINEGAARASALAYADIAPGATPDGPYVDRCNDACRKMALLGGFRLANQLKKLLGP